MEVVVSRKNERGETMGESLITEPGALRQIKFDAMSQVVLPWRKEAVASLKRSLHVAAPLKDMQALLGSYVKITQSARSAPPLDVLERDAGARCVLSEVAVMLKELDACPPVRDKLWPSVRMVTSINEAMAGTQAARKLAAASVEAGGTSGVVVADKHLAQSAHTYVYIRACTRSGRMQAIAQERFDLACAMRHAGAHCCNGRQIPREALRVDRSSFERAYSGGELFWEEILARGKLAADVGAKKWSRAD
eukprot:1148760-Pleurochrysis_carterae.AAC.1